MGFLIPHRITHFLRGCGRLMDSPVHPRRRAHRGRRSAGGRSDAAGQAHGVGHGGPPTPQKNLAAGSASQAPKAARWHARDTRRDAPGTGVYLLGFPWFCGRGRLDTPCGWPYIHLSLSILICAWSAAHRPSGTTPRSVPPSSGPLVPHWAVVWIVVVGPVRLGPAWTPRCA
jgi:hypothetical protein